MSKIRYFIKKNINSDMFFSGLSYDTCTAKFLSVYSYVPSIYEYPISFRSVDSLRDYLYNQIRDCFNRNSQLSIDSHSLFELSNLAIVSTQEPFNISTNFANEYQLNFKDEFLKAFWKFKAEFLFKPQFVDFYINKTEFEKRRLGSFNTSETFFMVPTSQLYQVSDLLSRCYNQGIRFEHNRNLLTFFSIEDMNLLSLTTDISINTFIKSEDLQNLERNVLSAYSLNLSTFH